MRQVLLLVALGLFGLIELSQSVCALDWEIERSFRYFRYTSDGAIQRIAFDLVKIETASTPTVEAVEARLNGGSFWTSPLPSPRPKEWPVSWQNTALRTPRDLLVQLRRSEGRSANIPPAAELDRIGWASLLDDPSSDQNATCWNTNTRLHDGCREHGGYVRPDGWIVRVFDVEAAAGDQCDWTGPALPARVRSVSPKTAPPEQTVKGDCREQRFYVPAAAGQPSKAVSGGAKITRARPGSTPDEVILAPSDRIIVGFGDSFTSGEGNPERPAVFSPTVVTQPLYLPRRATAGLESSAHWTDRWCHRSIYSWQMRTGIALAMADLKTSITLLPYGCSGAEITEGLVYGYNGVEYAKPDVAPQGHPAQIGLAYQELCSRYVPPPLFPSIPDAETDSGLKRGASGDVERIKADAARYVARCGGRGDVFSRQVDLVLLGIGVNDVGFSRWVAGALLTGHGRAIASGFIPSGEHDGVCDGACLETKLRAERLRGRYQALKWILDEHFLKAAQVPANRVLVELYPNAIEDRRGSTCGRGSSGLTVMTFDRSTSSNDQTRACNGDLVKLWPFGNTIGRGAAMAVRDPKDLDAIQSFLDSSLNRNVRDFASLGANGYTLVSEYLPRFPTRGFCATSDVSAPKAPGCWTFPDLMAADRIECDPRQTSCRDRLADSLHIDRYAPYGWRPSSPVQFAGYWHRTRLFRTPNDVFLLINKRDKNTLDTTPIGPLDLATRGTSGAFHPTAEAHALVADAVVAAANR